jgi:hypothetical protein
MIKSEIIADSINPHGNRITTFICDFPRIILAEVNTHRAFSRNSASSRAIPFNKMVEKVKEQPFIPMAWQKDHKGMQGTEYFGGRDVKWCEENWLEARDYAVKQATTLSTGHIEGNSYVTKQLCNRLLEPFMYHRAIITATEYENFFTLRCPEYSWQGEGSFRSWKDLVSSAFHDGASRDWVDGLEDTTILERLKNNKGMGEIHIMALAESMWDNMNHSTPKLLEEGEWHIPFGDEIDTISLSGTLYELKKEEDPNFLDNHIAIHFSDKTINQTKVKIATARCARISYQTLGDNPKIDYKADIKLHDILASNGHASPFEHIAQAAGKDVISRNFRGFKQYREILENK